MSIGVNHVTATRGLLSYRISYAHHYIYTYISKLHDIGLNNKIILGII